MLSDDSTNLLGSNIALFCFRIECDQQHKFGGFQIINHAISRPLPLLDIRILNPDFEDGIAGSWNLSSWGLTCFQLGDDRLDISLEMSVLLCQLADVAFKLRRKLDMNHSR